MKNAGTPGNKAHCQTIIKADTQFNGFDSKHSHRYCNHIMVRFVIGESDFHQEVLRRMDDCGYWWGEYHKTQI